MGALTPVAGALSAVQGAFTALSTLENTVGLFSQSSNEDQAVRQLQERQQLEQQQSAQNASLERERLAVQSAQDEEERRNALRRAVARQRAQFGSSGTGGQGGSADAVLLGLFDETDSERVRREELDNLRTRALDLGLAQQRSLNVLQATQLAERQNLSRLF